MNSRQLNFYLNSSDQHLFDQMLTANRTTKFCQYQTEQARPYFLESSIIRNMGEEVLKIILVRESDVKNIQYRKIEGRNIYSIDTVRSPVMEYSRCYVNDKFVRRGRLYFLKTYYNDQDVLVNKAPDFLSWENQIFDEAKEILIPYKSGEFMGPGAFADVSSGLEFVSV